MVLGRAHVINDIFKDIHEPLIDDLRDKCDWPTKKTVELEVWNPLVASILDSITYPILVNINFFLWNNIDYTEWK
jgi:hypothetical protein